MPRRERSPACCLLAFVDTAQRVAATRHASRWPATRDARHSLAAGALRTGVLLLLLTPAPIAGQIAPAVPEAHGVFIPHPRPPLDGVLGPAPVRLVGSQTRASPLPAFPAVIPGEGSDTSTSAARGARKGLLIGAAVGFTFTYLICDGASCRLSPSERFERALVHAAVDGALGAFIGWKGWWPLTRASSPWHRRDPLDAS